MDTTVFFNGWVVRAGRDDGWQLLVQRATPSLSCTLGLAGGIVQAGESLHDCIARELARTIPGVHIRSIVELSRDFDEADPEIDLEAQEVFDLLITVESGTPTTWHQSVVEPRLPDVTFEIDWEWKPLTEWMQVGNDTQRLDEVRRRLGVSGPPPYVIVRWRPNPPVDAPPGEISKALLCGQPHRAVLPFRIEPLPPGWDMILPSHTVARHQGHVIGLIFRISAESSMREHHIGWAMSRWPLDPLAAFDPQTRRYYEPGWEVWHSRPVKLGERPNLFIDLSSQRLAHLARLWARPLKVLNCNGYPDERATQKLDPNLLGEDSIILPAEVDDAVVRDTLADSDSPLASPRLAGLIDRIGWAMIKNDRETNRHLLLAADENAWLIDAMLGACRAGDGSIEQLFRREDELIARLLQPGMAS